MQILKYFSILTLLIAFSCSSESSSDTVDSLIEELKQSNSLDEVKVNELITSIDDFVANDTLKSEKTPNYLELKAKYLTALGNHQESLNVYESLYTNYKTYTNSSDALFMMAFIYENHLDDKKNAEDHYKKYLSEFPEGEFAKDAKFSIENINLTPEELMKKFEDMNKDAATD